MKIRNRSVCENRIMGMENDKYWNIGNILYPYPSRSNIGITLLMFERLACAFQVFRLLRVRVDLSSECPQGGLSLSCENPEGRDNFLKFAVLSKNISITLYFK